MLSPDKGTPAVRRVRKATGLLTTQEPAGLPKWVGKGLLAIRIGGSIMQFISKRALVLGATVTLGLTGVAQAATDDTGVVVTGGSATMTAPAYSDFPGVTLNGAAQSAGTAVSDWSVNDARGTGAGWEVTVAASALTTGGVTPVTMTGATLTLAPSTASPTDVSNASTAPVVAGGDVLAGTVKVADADAGTGLGDWALAQGADDLSLGVPANARAGSYTSTITTTLTPGV